MAKAKIKAKRGKKPRKSIEGAKVIKGEKKGPSSKSEVAGHTSPGAYYRCWRCGALNYVPWGYDSFYCWNDWVLNLV